MRSERNMPICNFWWGLRLLHCGERGSASLTATYKFCKSSVLGSSRSEKTVVHRLARTLSICAL